MATRIEQQMQLRSVGSAPIAQPQIQPVQPIGFQVAAQAQGQMAQLIQRMSDRLFAEAGQMAQQEGLRYAAENPLTPEEIELAKVGAITEPTGRIFDDAFRRARSIQLAAHFEAEGMNDMMRLLPDIEAGRIGSDQVITKLREMNAGYTASLAKIDPGAAMKFNASMAASGNTLVRKALDTEIKNAKEQTRIKFDVYADRVFKLLQPTIETNPEQAEQLINMHRVNVANQALAMGDAGLQREYSAKFETQVREAKIAVLTKTLVENEDNLENPMPILRGLNEGFIQGRMQPLLASMKMSDAESVAKVTANFMTAVAQRQTLKEQQRKETERFAISEITPLYAQALNLSDNDPRKTEVVNRIMEIGRASPGAVPWSMVSTLFKPRQVENEAMEFNARMLIDNGSITDPNQIWSLTEGKSPITGGQALQLLNYFNSSNRRTETEKNTMLSRLAGVPTVPGQVVMINPKSDEFQRRLALVKQTAIFESEAQEKGERLTLPELESKLTGWLTTKRNAAEVSMLRQRLKVYEDRVKGTITESDLAALEKSGRLNGTELVQVRKILQQIKEAEGK